MGQWDTRLWAPHAPQNVIVGRRGMARSMDSSRLDEDAMSASRFLSESFFFYMNSQLYVQGAHCRGEWQRQCARTKQPLLVVRAASANNNSLLLYTRHRDNICIQICSAAVFVSRVAMETHIPSLQKKIA